MSQGFGAAKGFGRRGGVVPTGSAAKSNAVSRPDDTYLEDPAVQAVMREFELCVIVLALAMSVMNRPVPDRIVKFSLSNFQQPAVTRFPALQPVLDDHGMPEHHIEALADFHQAFAIAGPYITEITSDMPNGFDRGWMVDASLMMFAAAQAALGFIASVPGLHALCKASQDGLSPAAELEQTLRSCIKGDAPYWNVDSPSVPEWQLKRNACRHSVNSSAKLSDGENSEDVIVTDVSRLGFGLMPAPKCDVGAKIWVRLESGRTIIAELKWKDENRAGAGFLTPLGLNDPLIAIW
jgi:hypothetical protein